MCLKYLRASKISHGTLINPEIEVGCVADVTVELDAVHEPTFRGERGEILVTAWGTVCHP